MENTGLPIRPETLSRGGAVVDMDDRPPDPELFPATFGSSESGCLLPLLFFATSILRPGTILHTEV